MTEEKSITSESKRLSFIRSLSFKTLIPIVIISFLVIGFLGIYISTKTKNDSKEFLTQNVLMPEFELLAKEKNTDFERIENLTAYTAQKIEDRINASKNRTNEEVDVLFNRYISKKPDGSYRSELDESRGRFQMAAFHNNKEGMDIREKGIFVDAFLFFDPFGESQMPFVYTTYFATNNSIWQYGFPEWALTSAANETFDKYSWFYEADAEHDPDRRQVWTDMYFDEFQGQWMISSLMPIYDGEEFLGIVGQDFTLQKIIEITQGSKIGNTGILFFIDNLDNIVAHPDTEFLIGKTAANDERLNLKTLPDKALTKVLQNLPNESGFQFTEENDRRIVMYFPLESVNWKMVYVVNEEEFLRIATETSNQYITSFVLFTLFIIVLIVLIINFRVAQPIKKLTKATNEISQGNLDKKIDIKSKDEIGQLASAFNKMTEDLKKSQEQIKKHSEDLEKQVAGRTEELGSKIKELETNRAAVLNMMEDSEEANMQLMKAQEELKKAVDELKKEDVKKDEFISVTAHEFKTPLTAIHGFAELLQEKKIDAKSTRKYLTIIREETDRLAKLVTEILNLSRIDLGTLKLTFEEIDLNKMVESIRSEADIKIKTGGLKSQYDVEKNLKIETDREKLTEILLNILDNAAKYTPKGAITTKIFREAGNMHFMVKDTGIGIPKEAQPKIFERFYQVDSSSTRKAGGTGLGLSVSKEYVTIMGGKMWFVSEAGKGTEFHFTLPIKAPKKGEAKEKYEDKSELFRK
jgi:signal transduction histidine kinase